MSRKDFIKGIVTGVLATLIIIAIAITARVVYCRQHNKNVKSNIGESVMDTISGTKVEAKDEKDYVLGNQRVAEKVMELEDTIDELFIEDVSNEKLEEGIYKGIMEALDDPYACYYTSEELKELQMSTQGVYYGIGARLMTSKTTSYPQIVGVFEGSPAEEAGLMANDYIYKVNGEDMFDVEVSEVASKIKGEEGTTVTLTIVREVNGETFDVEVERRALEVPTVEFKMLDEDVAYIQIEQFDTITVEQFTDALAEARGNNMKALVLDLRGNPGGSLASVVEIGNNMLPKGTIVYTEDKYGEREDYTSSGKHVIDVPMVVLVDGGSASASEILAGAIKDYKLGTIMGTTTYGKGIVQRVVTFKDGSAAKLTVSHYYTPNGNDIHKVGIEPDVEVEFDAKAYLENPDDDNQLEAAHQYLRDELDK